MHLFSTSLIVISVIMSSSARSQPADVDALSHDLDLSILNQEETATESGSRKPYPADHLFYQFDLLPEIPGPSEVQWQAENETPLVLLSLPESTYLVVPNPARLDQAYRLLAKGLDRTKLDAAFPLKIVLHADGNFSLAVAIEEKPIPNLPQGVDLSPVPEMKFAGVVADIQLLRKNHAPVLQAFVLLQSEAKKVGWELDTSEFYYFPQSPGKVLFALPVKTKSPIGKKQKMN